jgi:hypothetical protein
VLKVIVRRETLPTTGTIYNIGTQLLAYADDIDIVGRSQPAVRYVYLALEIEVGLKINEQKTKYMIVTRNDGTIRDVGAKRGPKIENGVAALKKFIFFNKRNQLFSQKPTTNARNLLNVIEYTFFVYFFFGT